MRDQDERIQALEAETVTLPALAKYLGWGTLPAAEAFAFACQREGLLRRAQAELDTHQSDAATAELAILDRISRLKAAESQLNALPQQLEALRQSYVQHKAECARLSHRRSDDGGWTFAFPPKDCTCGLDALLIALSAHVG